MDETNTLIDNARLPSILQKIDRPIALIGMMGVGKSSVGKRLASLLDCPFIDADDEIEKSAQMTIPEMFEMYGEAYFRDGERRVLARLMDCDNGRKVIATGGGAFCNPETRALILEKAIAVWLDSDVDTLVERTARKTNRPLLQGGNPREILSRLRDDRRSEYAQAPIHVVSENGPHSKTVTSVLNGIDAWL